MRTVNLGVNALGDVFGEQVSVISGPIAAAVRMLAAAIPTPEIRGANAGAGAADGLGVV